MISFTQFSEGRRCWVSAWGNSLHEQREVFLYSADDIDHDEDDNADKDVDDYDDDEDDNVNNDDDHDDVSVGGPTGLKS